MRKKSIAVAIGSWSVIFPLSALADGLVLDGHVNGPHTRVLLTNEQIRALEYGRGFIQLTIGQRKALQGLPGADRVKQVWILPKSTKTCTCELEDVAVRINRNTIEVADFLFGRELEKQIRQQADWTKRRLEQEKAEMADLRTVPPSREAVLNKKGLDQKDAMSSKAIEYFKMALQVNPNYKWARRNIAMSYDCLGSQAMYGKANFGEAVRYLELALKTADPADSLFIDHVTKSLKIAKLHEKTGIAAK